MKIVMGALAVLALFAVSEVIRLARMIRKSKSDRAMVARIERHNLIVETLELLQAIVDEIDGNDDMPPQEFSRVIERARLVLHKAKGISRAAA